MAEEDPEYRLVEDLQNAGIIPVDNFGRGVRGRPRGVSASIPQSAIDEMLNAPDQTNTQHIQEVMSPVRQAEQIPTPMPVEEEKQQSARREVELP
jgi:hypothetical protein